MSNFCLLAEIWLNKFGKKSALGVHGGSEKWFSGMCRRTWCGHSRVMITLVFDTMTLSWLIGACQQLRESHEREPFFRSMFFCFSLLGCSWSERFVVFSERPLLFFSVADRDRQGRQRLRFLDEVAGSLTKLRCDGTSLSGLWLFFFFSLFLYFFISFVKKRRLWPGRSTSSPTKGQRSSFAERTMKFPILIFQLQLVLVPAVPLVTVFRGRCTRQL